MPRSYAQECNGWSIWTTTILFPVPKCVYANSESGGEFFLGHLGKTTDGDNILTAREVSPKNPLALPSGYGTSKIFFCQLMNIFRHFYLANRLPVSPARFVLHGVHSGYE